MASAHILINGVATRHNQELKSLIEQLVAVRARVAHFKEVADQTALGGDWPAFAVLLGIESTGDAEAIYNLLGSVKNEVEGPFITQFVSRLG